jgi:hypothetical protein
MMTTSYPHSPIPPPAYMPYDPCDYPSLTTSPPSPPSAASSKPRDIPTLRKVMGLDDRFSRRNKGRQPILPGVRTDASTRLRSFNTLSSSEGYTRTTQPAVTKYAKKYSESSGRADTSRISGAWALDEDITGLEVETRKDAQSRSRHEYSDNRRNSPDHNNAGMTLPSPQPWGLAKLLSEKRVYHQTPNRDGRRTLSSLHTKPFRCEIPDCKRAKEGFTTRNDLDRHHKSVHRIGLKTKSYQCAASGCRNAEKIWPRLDNFKQHIERMHKDENALELIERLEFYSLGLLQLMFVGLCCISKSRRSLNSHASHASVLCLKMDLMTIWV